MTGLWRCPAARYGCWAPLSGVQPDIRRSSRPGLVPPAQANRLRTRSGAGPDQVVERRPSGAPFVVREDRCGARGRGRAGWGAGRPGSRPPSPSPAPPPESLSRASMRRSSAVTSDAGPRRGPLCLANLAAQLAGPGRRSGAAARRRSSAASRVLHPLLAGGDPLAGLVGAPFGGAAGVVQQRDQRDRGGGHRPHPGDHDPAPQGAQVVLGGGGLALDVDGGHGQAAVEGTAPTPWGSRARRRGRRRCCPGPWAWCGGPCWPGAEAGRPCAGCTARSRPRCSPSPSRRPSSAGSRGRPSGCRAPGRSTGTSTRSRANTARRVILRRCASRGMRT